MQIFAIVVSLAITAVAVIMTTRAVRSILGVIGQGQAAPGRSDAPLSRLITMVKETFGHTRMLQWTWVGTLHWFADPLGMLDAFVSLVLIGVLLALVRHWTGAIAATMGLHMGWVWVLKVTIGVTQPPGDAPGAFLVSRFDGFTGWLIAGWTLVVLVVLVRNRERLCSLRAPGSASH